VCCRSFLSLLKYKFGVCADEQCFRHAAAAEVRALFAFWSALFARNQVFFVEAIEQLEVNEDIKLKCEAFMKELAEFFNKTELVVSELDYIDENILKLPYEDEASGQEVAGGAGAAPGQSCDELESFFTNLGLIDQFLLSYGTKLLHRFKPSLETSSLFMLLLEASEFIETSLPEEARPDDVFESAPSTPSNRTFDERFSTPLISYDATSPGPYDSLRTSSSPSDLLNRPLKPTQFKKTHAFLVDKSKGLGFYDVVFLQLDKNLCLTLLKHSRLNRFCQLIAEFDGVVQGFLDLLGRKRAGLKADAPGEDAFDRADRQSLGFFVNKVLSFYEGLASLKSELVAAGRQRRSGSGGFFKSELFGEQRRRRTRSSLSARHRRKESSDGGQEDEEASDEKTLARLRKVESLQLKIGRMTGSREFKLFFAWINNESGKGKPAPPLTALL